jgi:hypothetical protein
MNKSLIVAFVSDPFQALLYRERFELFKDELDQVVIGIAGKIPKVNEFIADLYKDCEIRLKVDYHMNQGQIFNAIYPFVKGDILVTMDADNFVFKKGIINRYTRFIEKDEYDIVGSHGQHARGPKFADALIARFKYVRMNPFMSFWRKEQLDKLENLNFETRVWSKPGTYDEEIDWKFEEDSIIDHMGVITIRMIRQGARILEIPGENPPEWIHPGAMATATAHHLLKDDGSATLNGSDNKSGNNPINIGMLGWWYFIWRRTKDKYPDKDFVDEYGRAIERKAGVSKLTMEQVKSYADNLEKNWEQYII